MRSPLSLSGRSGRRLARFLWRVEPACGFRRFPALGVASVHDNMAEISYAGAGLRGRSSRGRPAPVTGRRQVAERPIVITARMERHVRDLQAVGAAAQGEAGARGLQARSTSRQPRSSVARERRCLARCSIAAPAGCAVNVDCARHSPTRDSGVTAAAGCRRSRRDDACRAAALGPGPHRHAVLRAVAARSRQRYCRAPGYRRARNPEPQPGLATRSRHRGGAARLPGVVPGLGGGADEPTRARSSKRLWRTR